MECLAVVRGDVGDSRIASNWRDFVGRDHADGERGEREDAPEYLRVSELHDGANEECGGGTAGDDVADEQWAACVVCPDVNGFVEAYEFAGRVGNEQIES